MKIEQGIEDKFTHKTYFNLRNFVYNFFSVANMDDLRSSSPISNILFALYTQISFQFSNIKE